MRKAEIQFHREYAGPAHAAINVKVRGYWGEPAGPGSLAAVFRQVATEEGDAHPERFTPAWAATLPEPWRARAWEDACTEGWDLAREEADYFLGAGMRHRVSQEGRSGGWLVVDAYDRETVAGWDAIALGRWARYVRAVDAITADTWRRYAWRLYVDYYQPAEDGIAAGVEAHTD